MSSEPRREPVPVAIPPREVVRTVLVACGVLLGLLVVWQAREVLFLVLLAILLATAIEPLVDRLRRGPFSRGMGILVVYTAIVLVFALPTYLILPGLVAEGGSFLQDLPARLVTLRSYVAAAPQPIQQAAETIERSGQAAARPAPPESEQLLQAGLAAAHTLFDVITVFVLAFYWVVERATLKRVLLRAVPRRHVSGVDAVWREVEEKLGAWVRGELVLMFAIGVMSGVGYWALGLPHPLLLAVLAGALEIVPMIGPILSSAPAVLVALANDPLKAIVVAGYALLIQQIENNILLPRIMGHTIGISPIVVLIGILCGAALYGLAGAFLAVPVAGGLQVILAHALRSEDPEQAEVHTEATTS